LRLPAEPAPASSCAGIDRPASLGQWGHCCTAAAGISTGMAKDARMPISLSEYETGKAFDGNYGKTIAILQSRLERIQIAHIIHHKPAILVF
jgi:hypothetical protein